MCVTAPVITSIAPTQGPSVGGSIVTLTGTNLGANDITSVTLVGIGASAVTWVTSTQVRVVTAAAAAGTGPVMLTSAAHGITSFSSYTYLEGTLCASL